MVVEMTWNHLPIIDVSVYLKMTGFGVDRPYTTGHFLSSETRHPPRPAPVPCIKIHQESHPKIPHQIILVSCAESKENRRETFSLNGLPRFMHQAKNTDTHVLSQRPPPPSPRLLLV